MSFLIKYKKFFILIGFISAVILMGYLLFVMFFQPAKKTTISDPATPVSTEPGKLPTSGTGTSQIIDEDASITLPGQAPADTKKPDAIASGGITTATTLIENKIINPTLNSDGLNLNYLNQDDGKFYKISKDGNIVALSDKVFHSVENIVWSPVEDKAIIEYPDGANIVYNFETEKQITLPAHWKDFKFAPNGNNIVAKSIGMDASNRWLIVANDDGSGIKPIEPMGDKQDTVYPSWSPNNQIVAMYTEGIDADNQEVFFMGLNDENFKSMVVPGRGFQHEWSPTGDRLLYSVYNTESQLKPELWIASASGDTIGKGRHRLNVETWAEKCTFSSDTELICAVPESLEYASGMIPELAKDVPDRLYRIDTETGLKKLIAIPEAHYSMQNLIISDNGYYLYFTDKNDNQLHQIKLKQ